MTTAPSIGSETSRLETHRVDIGRDEYVSGEIHIAWPDGSWPIKLPTAEIQTIDLKDGKTSSLSLFIWNALAPGSQITLYPPRQTTPGGLVIEHARPTPEPRSKGRSRPTSVEEDSRLSLLLAAQRAVDRLGTPVRFELVWALLNDRGIEMPPSQVIGLLRESFHVDDHGEVRLHDDVSLDDRSFRPEDCQWDNIEQAYWELNQTEEPPNLEQMYRKRRSSSHDGLEQHLDEISHRLLTVREEEELGGAIRAGQLAAEQLGSGEEDYDRKVELGLAIRAADEAREQFQRHNLRLVFNIARKYLGQLHDSPLGLEDLVQAGYLGLLRAVEKFDPDKGFKFSTYATWWIKQSISREIADKSRVIRLPIHLHDKVRSYQRYKAWLSADLGRPPSVDEIVEAAGLTEAEVRSVEAIHKVETLPEDESFAPDLASDEVDLIQEVIRKDTRSSLLSALDSLDDRLAHLLIERYGLKGKRNRTLEEIGQEMGVTRERVRQLERKALDRLVSEPQIQQFHNEPASDLESERAGLPRILTKEQEAAWQRVRDRARVIEARNRG